MVQFAVGVGAVELLHSRLEDRGFSLEFPVHGFSYVQLVFTQGARGYRGCQNYVGHILVVSFGMHKLNKKQRLSYLSNQG